MITTFFKWLAKAFEPAPKNVNITPEPLVLKSNVSGDLFPARPSYLRDIEIEQPRQPYRPFSVNKIPPAVENQIISEGARANRAASRAADYTELPRYHAPKRTSYKAEE